MKKDWIHFFGTTGSKEVFFKKIRSSGGLYIHVDDTNIIFDPGVNTFYPYLQTYQEPIDGIVLSHVHIDHSNDLNIFVELMTNGGKEKRGTVLVPSQAIEENILYPYVRNFPENLQIVKPNATYFIKNVEITASIAHKHGVENYGFKLKTQKQQIGLVTDTAYFPELLFSYQGCEILIVNVPYETQEQPNPKHLAISDVEEMIKAIQPQKVILTHFNTNILNANPAFVAEKLSQTYGLQVIAAEDNKIFEL